MSLFSFAVIKYGHYYYIFERVIDKKLSAAKVTFGAEPKDIEVLEFINRNYYHLHFSPEIETTVKETKKNPKRAQRDANKRKQRINVCLN